MPKIDKILDDMSPKAMYIKGKIYFALVFEDSNKRFCPTFMHLYIRKMLFSSIFYDLWACYIIYANYFKAINLRRLFIMSKYVVSPRALRSIW